MGRCCKGKELEVASGSVGAKNLLPLQINGEVALFYLLSPTSSILPPGTRDTAKPGIKLPRESLGCGESRSDLSVNLFVFFPFIFLEGPLFFLGKLDPCHQ